MYLFFDTETTGLPKNWKAPITELDNWPRLVQLAWELHDETGRVLTRFNSLVKPDGFIIPNEATAVHGITTAQAIAQGKKLSEVCLLIFLNMKENPVLVAHNISYDAKVLGCEFLRLKLPTIKPPLKKICTMFSSTQFCKFPAPQGGYKWPKLSELYKKLFGCDFEGAHDAASDISATAKCFWELKRLGVIKV